MKNLAIIFLVGVCMVFMTPAVKAQTSLVSRYSVTTDTVTNTGTKNMTTPSRITGAAQSVVVTTANTVLTGTMAGIARLYGSLDGVKYQRIRTFQLHNSQVDSLVLDAAHPNYAWVVDNNPFQYYQVQTTGIGTTTFTVKSLIVKH